MNLTTLKNAWIGIYSKLLELNFYSSTSNDVRIIQKFTEILSNNWFNYLDFIQEANINGLNDWRWGILPKFIFLEAMCNLAQNTVNEVINTFDKSKLVTAIALTPNEFSSSQTLVVIDTMIQG